MKDQGTIRIASEIVEDLKQDGSKLGTGTVQGVNDNFIVDAWLANWDVAGLSYDNLLIKGKKPYGSTSVAPFAIGHREARKVPPLVKRYWRLKACGTMA